MRRWLLTSSVALATVLGAAPSASATREPFPHAFHHNMGYCAPYLAQLRTGDGTAVRAFINHLLHDLTTAGLFEGQKNVGDLYSDRARSELDQMCLPRS